MIERAIYALLVERVTWFLADPTRLDQIFQPEGDKTLVPDAEMVKIRDGLTALRPTIRHGYATSPAEVPCVAVVLANEQPDKMFLGDLAGLDPDDPQTEAIGIIEARTYSLICYGRGTDYVRYLYRLVKHAVLSRLSYLKSIGVMDPTFSGADIEPVPQYLTERVFIRALTLRCRVEEYYVQVTVPDPLVELGKLDIMRTDVGGGVTPVEELSP